MNLLIHRTSHNLIRTCLAAILTLAVLLTFPEPVEGFRQASVAAQTVVQLSPSALDLPLGGSGTVSLEVLGGLAINAYDVTVRYDPAVITFVSWSHGGYLSHLAQVYKVDEPGTLRLVFTQLATPPVSGDGILLNLVFRGAAEGSSEVFIERLDFAGSDGTITNPQLIGATIRVDATLPTPQPTAAPTSTLPPAANTPVATATQGLAVIATPDLTRIFPVMGTATPTRRLTTVKTPASVASTGSATGGAVTVLRQAQEGQLVEVPQSAASAYPYPAGASSCTNRSPRADWRVDRLNLRPPPQPGTLGSPGRFLIAIVWMVLVAIRRSKTQSSDKE